MFADEWKLGLSEGAYDLKSFQVFEGKTDCSLCHVGISNPKQLLGRSQHARGWAQAQSAAEPNSNHFHTKSQRSVNKKEDKAVLDESAAPSLTLECALRLQLKTSL